jgi:hypothetical protein
MAPISMPSMVARMPLSSAIPLKSTTTFGFLIRSLSQSKLSRLPASTQASLPCCSSSCCASATEPGWSRSKAGMPAADVAWGARLRATSESCRHSPAPAGIRRHRGRPKERSGWTRRRRRRVAHRSRAHPSEFRDSPPGVNRRPAPGFERRQNRVGIHRRPLEYVVTEGVRKSVQDGRAGAADGWLTDPARTHRSFGIRLSA